MRYLFFLLSASIFLSCKAQPKKILEIKEVMLKDLTKDTVIVFLKGGNDTLNIFREIEILNNDNKDTIILGYSIIPPKFTGKIWFIQNSLDKSSAVYLDRSKDLDLTDPFSYSKLFTIGLWNQKYDRGFEKIVFKLKLE